MATLFSDAFNRANNVSLGADWTERGGTSNIDIVTNRAEAITLTGSFIGIAHTATWGVADYTVQVIVNTPAGNTFYGTAGRRVNQSTDDSDCYAAFVNETNDTLTLYKRIAGSYTNLGSFAVTIAASTDYTVKLSMQGITIKAFLDGTERISVTDASLSANGDSAITTGTSGVVGGRFDDFLVEDFAAPAAGHPTMRRWGGIPGMRPGAQGGGIGGGPWGLNDLKEAA